MGLIENNGKLIECVLYYRKLSPKTDLSEILQVLCFEGVTEALNTSNHLDEKH